MIEFLLTSVATVVRLIVSALPEAALTLWTTKAPEENAAKLEKSDLKTGGCANRPRKQMEVTRRIGGQSGRRFTAGLIGVMLAVQTLAAPLPQQSGNAEKIKARARELQANASDVRIRLADGSTVNGKILRVEEDSFTVQQKTGAEVTVPFAQVTQFKKKGVSKAIWIPAIAAGATLLVLCAAPYPIGFLCRKDPS